MATQTQMKRQKSVGVSFSGGGVPAWAEIAVYEDLMKQGIEIDAVAGTSMGAFLAAAVACDLSADEIYEIIQDTDEAIHDSSLFGGPQAILNLVSFRQPLGIVLIEKLEKVIHPVSELYSEFMLSDVPKPLAIPAVDIIENKLVIFSNQPEYFDKVYENAEFYDGDIPLLQACLASSAYPIILSPVKMDDYQLVDGGVLMNSPSSLLSREKIEHVFAIGFPPSTNDGPADRRLEVGLRAISVMINDQVEMSNRSVDQTYRLDLNLPDTFQFGNSQMVLDAGRAFVKENPVDTTDFFEHMPVTASEEKKEPEIQIVFEEPETIGDKVGKWVEKVKEKIT